MSLTRDAGTRSAIASACGVILQRHQKLLAQHLAGMDGAHLVLGFMAGSLSVVIHNFRIACFAVLPEKAQTKLVIDANAVLSCAITFQGFQSVSWWRPQEFRRGCTVELLQFSLGGGFEVYEALDVFALEQCLRILASERFDHVEMMYRITVSGIRFVNKSGKVNRFAKISDADLIHNTRKRQTVMRPAASNSCCDRISDLRWKFPTRALACNVSRLPPLPRRLRRSARTSRFARHP